MNTHYQAQVHEERSRMHASNQQFREKLEVEALDYQQEVSKGTEQQGCDDSWDMGTCNARCH
eukprot:3593440-Amphidinium_carterae.1